MTVELVRFEDQYSTAVWQCGFSKQKPVWKEWDGPYFDDYESFSTAEAFRGSNVWQFLKSANCCCIVVDNQPIGVVSRHWENEKTRWMEIGIVIYDERYWHSGYGATALKMWTTQTFEDYPMIEHLGLTTWSGNLRMMKVAEKIGYQKEAHIRAVRYWQGTYYDSVKYGVLKSEWLEKQHNA